MVVGGGERERNGSEHNMYQGNIIINEAKKKLLT